MKAATHALVLMIVDTHDREQETALLDYAAHALLQAFATVGPGTAFTCRVPVRDGHIVDYAALDTYVLLTLAYHGEGTIEQIIERLADAGMATYTRSHIANLLKKMLDAGVVSRRRDGYAFVYAADTNPTEMNPAEAGILAGAADA